MNTLPHRFAHILTLSLISGGLTISTSAPSHASTLSDFLTKLISAPSYGPFPNLLDNQPTPTDTCNLIDRSNTETANGNNIGVRNYGCVINNRNVVFSVSIPKLCETVSCGLIVDQHGATMNAEQENNGTHLREYGQQAMRYGASTPYIVIQPNMTDLIDQVTNKVDLVSVMGLPYSNELPALLAFVANAKTALHVDPKRVHFHGFSRGGFTASKVYCDPKTKGQFASMVGSGSFLGCAVDRPYMQFIGETDPNSLVAAGVAQRFHSSGANREVIIQDANWQVPTLKFMAGKPTLVGKQQHLRYTLDGHVLENVQHSGLAFPLAGHCLPYDGPAGWLVCPTNFDMGRKILNFFIQHPME
ncbi:MAG: hypothetical protein Q7U28_13305 [Aquabacterium sp.]|nr:hypothetical protein [Aquabacterium sp.]